MPNRKVLLIAHDFPPMNGGGCPRPLSFARYLPEFGYDVVVLTRGSTCGQPVDYAPLETLPDAVRIERIEPDLDGDWSEYVARRLRWARPAERLLGKPQDWLADGLAWRLVFWKPDWPPNMTWIRPAVRLGRQLVREHRPNVIIATGPPFASLKVGAILAEETGLPFVADYRDPWTYAYLWNPRSPRHAKSELTWERRVIERATHILCATPSMVARMRDDYPEHQNKLTLLTNGFDGFPDTQTVLDKRPKMIVSHIGTLYEDRWPIPVLDAMRLLKEKSSDIGERVLLRFIGPSTRDLNAEIAERSLQKSVEFIGPVPATESKRQMLASDVLLLYEVSGAMAIPGKCFEYLRAGRPIIAVVQRHGDAEWFLNKTNCARIIGPADPCGIASAMIDLYRQWKTGTLSVQIDSQLLNQFHRRTVTAKFAKMLDEVFDDPRAEGARGKHDTARAHMRLPISINCGRMAPTRLKSP